MQKPGCDLPPSGSPRDWLSSTPRSLSPDPSLWLKVLSYHFRTQDGMCLGLGSCLGQCSGIRGDSAGGCRQWGKCAGVGCAPLRTHSLWPACHPDLHPWELQGMNHDYCQVLTRDEGHRWPCAKVHGESKIQPTPTLRPHARGKWKSRKNPFWESLPWTCPQPIPADLGAGPGSGSQRTHLFPCARPTDNSVGTRAPGQWMFQGSAQMGTGFQSISLPWMGRSHLWPKHPPENDTDGLGGGQGPQAKSLPSQPVEPLAGLGPFSAGVWQ